jgi:chromosome segregation ATPase
LGELAQDAEQKNKALKNEMEASIRKAKELQKSLDAIQKQLLNKKNLDFEDKKKINDVLKQQKELEKKIQELREKYDQNNQLQNEMKSPDPELAEKEKQLEKLFDELMTPEMKKMMEELEKLMAEVNKEKIPHYIYAANGEILTMAGIYDVWSNSITGETLKSFAILTTHANQMMSEIHNVKHRMPVIIDNNNAKSWLNSKASERLDFCKPCSNDYLTAHSVSPKLNINKNNRNESWAIEPAKTANQTTLF